MPFQVITEVLWFILPAWVANSVAIDVSGLPILKDYSLPVDFGATWRGRRILGDGKTWRGLICGVSAGMACAAVQGLYPQPGLAMMTPYLGFLLGFGALGGDMAESFLKRMAGFQRGHPMFLLDQLDYIIGAFFLAWTVVPVNLLHLLVACVITLPLHVIASIVAYKVKLKENPW